MAALDTNELQVPQDEAEAAVTALLQRRKLSLYKEKVVLQSKEDNIFRLVGEAPPDSDERMCVTVKPRAGSTDSQVQAGDLLFLERCQHGPAEVSSGSTPPSESINIHLHHQLWKWEKATGEMVPYLSLAVAPSSNKDHHTTVKKPHLQPFCLTAGWPYLNAVAFVTPKQQTVVTVMNEYPTDTYILLKDLQKGSMWTALNGKSIQTITF